MPNFLKKLEAEVSTRPSFSVPPHALVARNSVSKLQKSGHVHIGRVLDIPFHRSIRDALSAAPKQLGQ
jgi:hypothetical protein